MVREEKMKLFLENSMQFVENSRKYIGESMKSFETFENNEEFIKSLFEEVDTKINNMESSKIEKEIPQKNLSSFAEVTNDKIYDKYKTLI